MAQSSQIEEAIFVTVLGSKAYNKAGCSKRGRQKTSAGTDPWRDLAVKSDLGNGQVRREFPADGD